MHIVLDIATSGFRGGIWSPTKLFVIDRPPNRSGSGFQASFIEKGWFFDNRINEEDRKSRENRVYDIANICRILSNESNETLEKRRKTWSFGCSRIENDDVELVVHYGDVESRSTLSQLLGEILTYMCRLVQNGVNISIRNYCILVPGDFGTPQNRLLHRAADDANCGRCRLVDERLASVVPYIYYGGISSEDARILLLDFGASSCRYSFVSMWKGHIRFHTSDSLSCLSGDAIDSLLLRYLSCKYVRQVGTSLSAHISDTTLLLRECERVKQQLSSQPISDVRLAPLGGKRNLSVSRGEFDALLRLPLTQLRRRLLPAVRRLKWRREGIDSILAIGGNAQIPAIRDMLQKLFPFSEHDYAATVKRPAVLGGALISEFSRGISPAGKYCYRFRVNEKTLFFVGKSVHCLSREIALISVTQPGVSLRVTVEQCDETAVLRLMAEDASPAGKDDWRFIFGYHYATTHHSIPRGETRRLVDETDVVRGESVEISAGILEDGRLAFQLAQISRGRYVAESPRRFIVRDGVVVEDGFPRFGVVSEPALFSRQIQKESRGEPVMTVATPSVTAGILADRTTSDRFVVIPAESEVSLAGDSAAFAISCANRHMRTNSMPALLNRQPALAAKLPRDLKLLMESRETNLLQARDLPPFQKSPLLPRGNKRQVFIGPNPGVSSLTVCCYHGSFTQGVPQGVGEEFGVGQQRVYKGTWGGGRYRGNGSLWLANGQHVEGSFIDGVLTGKGTIFDESNGVVYEGSFVDGFKEGEGMEQIDDMRYSGGFHRGKREGSGVLSRGTEVVYEGSWREGWREGHGREIVGGMTYVGEFHRDMRHGEGRLCRVDGQLVYEGQWANGKREGNGREILKGDIVYEGSFRDDKCEGFGRQLQDGVVLYEGEFANGLREGRGRVFNKDGSVAREGTFRGGQLNGECTIYYGSPQAYFVGSVVNDQPSGRGMEVTADGAMFEGEFLNGLRHGQGRLHNAQKALVYSGEWVCGQKHGQGVFQDDGGLYEGEFFRDAKCGFGKLTLFSGEQYVGEFVEDRFNGNGRFLNAAGKVTYDGEWRNGKRCGRGKKFFGDGQYFLGTFHNDAMWGEGVLFYENGAPAFVGEYRNDKRNGEGVAYDIGGEVVEKGFYVNDVCVISAMERYRVCYKQLILHYVTGLAVAR